MCVQLSLCYLLPWPFFCSFVCRADALLDFYTFPVTSTMDAQIRQKEKAQGSKYTFHMCCIQVSRSAEMTAFFLWITICCSFSLQTLFFLPFSFCGNEHYMNITCFPADLWHHIHPEQWEPNCKGCSPSLGSANYRPISRRQGAGLHHQLAWWIGLQCYHSSKSVRLMFHTHAHHPLENLKVLSFNFLSFEPFFS